MRVRAMCTFACVCVYSKNLSIRDSTDLVGTVMFEEVHIHQMFGCCALIEI